MSGERILNGPMDPTSVDGLVDARVLIVEDEGIVADDLQKGLRSFGYTVCGTSPSGEEAIDKATALQPDLVLIDIQLRGDMDGIEAARQIRSRIDVPVVFLSSRADTATVKRAAEVGPFAYVLKPFDDRELLVTLMMALCKHRAFAELDQRVRERTQRLAQAQEKYRELQSVAGLGLYALETPNIKGVLHRAVSLVAETLDVELVSVLELTPDGQSFLLRAGMGWADGLVGSAKVNAEPELLPGYTLEGPEPILVDDQREETRFELPPLMREHQVRSGISVVIHAPGPRDRPFGVMSTYAREARRFTQNDVNFLQAVGNLVATAIMRAAADATIVEAERKAEEERVRAALAEDALRARDEFLSVAAHELRTPVAALHLQLEALRDMVAAQQESIDSRIPEKVGRAAQTVSRLARLVEGVLDVSRIALGSLDLEMEEIDLAETVREVTARHDDLARRARCELRVEAPASLPGRWDRVRIEQVITNLLSNALKFGAGKPIDVRLEHVPGRARLIVRDRGEGIEPAQAERIMGRFERAVSHRSYGGLGLGLYIASRIVEGHGGKISVASSPGRGATFTVTLPCDGRRPEGSRPRPTESS